VCRGERGRLGERDGGADSVEGFRRRGRGRWGFVALRKGVALADI